MHDQSINALRLEPFIYKCDKKNAIKVNERHTQWIKKKLKLKQQQDAIIK